MNRYFIFIKKFIAKKYSVILPLITSCNVLRCSNSINVSNSQYKNNLVANSDTCNLNPVGTNVPNTKEDAVLVCLDFDGTIVNENAYAMLYDDTPHTNKRGIWFMYKGKIESDNPDISCENYNKKELLSITRSLLDSKALTLRKPQELRDLIDCLLTKGHKIAITTLGNHPFAIKVVLKELGLNENQIDNIPIIGSFYPNNETIKYDHINKARSIKWHAKRL
ncbi:hypothetical protein [Candidatus Cardinium hertigii]|uniref:hypothetical protein n=1 Tax=Candidatus Cardinium hertigii TaxID=247481 RepID=UPI001FAA5A6F|nr:hypothetical protein [Candidatus Cardinium hertigii]